MEVLSQLTGASAMRTFWVAHNFVVGGEIKVPSGQIDVIPSMFVAEYGSGIVKLAKIRHKIAAGTSSTFKLQKNGSDVSGATGISCTTTSTTLDLTDVDLTDGDELQVVVTAVSGTPTNMTVALILEYAS